MIVDTPMLASLCLPSAALERPMLLMLSVRLRCRRPEARQPTHLASFLTPDIFLSPTALPGLLSSSSTVEVRRKRVDCKVHVPRSPIGSQKEEKKKLGSG